MIREEAKSCICTIKMLQRLAYNIHGVMDVVDADNCKKIIKALEQEPCDAISRQAAIDAMYALCDTGETLKENPWRDNPYIDAIIDALDNLPSVTPQQKTGHWIFTKTMFDKFGCTVECPSCHKKWKTYDEIRWKKENKYCPNCGAKMDVNEEDY